MIKDDSDQIFGWVIGEIKQDEDKKVIALPRKALSNETRLAVVNLENLPIGEGAQSDGVGSLVLGETTDLQTLA